MSLDSTRYTQRTENPGLDQAPLRIMGTGIMPDLVRNFDWGTTPLGPIQGWSETLVSNVNQILFSPIPAILSWGDDFTFFYNEAAIPGLQGKHPGALGASYREVYKEVWHLVGQDLEDCYYRGATVIREKMFIPLSQNGIIQDGWFTYYLIPIFENGAIAGIYDPYQNMTEVVLAERERARQEERLELALSAANGVGIWDWDIPGDLVYTDANFAEIYGVDPADGARGISIASFTANIHQDDVDRVGKEIASTVRDGLEFSSEYRLLQPDGSVRWVFAKGRCYLDAEGKPLRFPGVSIDITDRKALEQALDSGAEELRRNEEKFRTFVEAVSDVVYRVSADWSVALEVEGRGFLSDTHAPDPDWFLRNVHPDDQARVRTAIEASIREGSIFQLEHKVQRLDGTPGWTFSRAIPVRDEHGTIIEWFGAASDITARKQAEQALLRTEKLAVVGRLASSIAHEINNPLEAVTNLLYLAAQTADLETKKLLDTAQEELQRVSHITTNTLQFNRQRLLPGPTDVVALMQSVLELYGGRFKQAGIQVLVENRDCPVFHALGGEIRQVFANLVGNALDAMKRGGTLKIRIRSGTNWAKGAQAVRVTVADNGHGMSAAVREQVFRPFFTTKEATGTGLGLWVSADILQRHHALVQIRSCETGPSRGTAFHLTFPQAGVSPA